MSEKTIDQMTPDELRAGIAEFARQQGPAASERPLPPGVDRAKLTPATAHEVAGLWVSSIMERHSSTWTTAEKQAINHDINRVLREEMGR
jgi:hypothetical protein